VRGIAAGRTARALLQSVLTVGDRNALLGGQGLGIAARHLVQLAAGRVRPRLFLYRSARMRRLWGRAMEHGLLPWSFSFDCLE